MGVRRSGKLTAARADVEERLQEAQIRTFESADAAAPATKYASPALSALVLTVPNESVSLDAYMVTLELRQLSSSLVTDELIAGITGDARSSGPSPAGTCGTSSKCSTPASRNSSTTTAR